MTFKQFIATDKLLHGSACFVLTVLFAAIYAFNPLNIGIGASFAALFAIGKEVYDYAHHAQPSDQLGDLCWDVIGTFLAVICLYLLTL